MSHDSICPTNWEKNRFFCTETLGMCHDYWQYQKVIFFYQNSVVMVGTQALFTNSLVAWLNLPPPQIQIQGLSAVAVALCKFLCQV